MKKALENLRNKFVNKKEVGATDKVEKVKDIISDYSGEGYIDTAVKILIAVVLGGLLLAGLYALFGETLLPTLTNRIQQMFNYNGGNPH